MRTGWIHQGLGWRYWKPYWPSPQRRFSSTGASVLGQRGYCVLASAGSDGAFIIWNPLEGARITRVLTDHGGGVRTLTAWSDRDRRFLATGGYDGTIRIWDAESGIRVGGPLAGHNAPIGTLMRVCDPDKGVIVSQSPSPHGPGVWALTCWEDETGERKLASGSLDGTICVWDANCLPISSPFGGHQASVSALSWWRVPGDGIRLASAGDDALIRVWEPGSGALSGTGRPGTAGPPPGRCPSRGTGTGRMPACLRRSSPGSGRPRSPAPSKHAIRIPAIRRDNPGQRLQVITRPVSRACDAAGFLVSGWRCCRDRGREPSPVAGGWSGRLPSRRLPILSTEPGR
jgi:WD domain, G-beta repeat